jgi:hypothetical protein
MFLPAIIILYLKVTSHKGSLGEKVSYHKDKARIVFAGQIIVLEAQKVGGERL